MSALVTGAGSGIGKRLAELLLARGDDVIALDLKFSDSARDDLEHAGARVHFVTADVRDAAAVQQAVDDGVAALGAPKLVVNCAGIGLAEPFTETSEDDYRRVVEINLFGTRNVAAAAGPHLTSGAHLVLMASMAGFVASYGYAAYSSSKFGVVGLAEVLRVELKPRGIDVSVIAPPEVMTPLVAEERAEGSAVTAKMKQFAGSLELEPAVRAILKGIDGRKFLIVPGSKARRTLLMQRFAPRRVTQAVGDLLVRRAMR